jgi:hypothetical protein
MPSSAPVARQSGTITFAPRTGAVAATLRKPISLPKYPGVLVLTFLLTLPLVNPWVRGDGVGYYAYVHSLLIDHDLNFENEWRAGNTSFVVFKLDANGKFDPSLYTSTGHLENHFAVGASILWAPFLIPVHGAILGLQRVGFHVRPDGFSKPYVLTMALATALYGFIGLLLCFKLACRYVDERWAFLATLGVWFATSLPVYMYFNPSYSHAHSVFAVSLFLWYWQRTRRQRTVAQWVILGLLSGLMLDVYYPNIMVLLVPLLESLQRYWRSWRSPTRDWTALGRLFFANVVYSLATVVAFLPTLIIQRIIYGTFASVLSYGRYGAGLWQWTSPALGKVLFSADHGLLAWTPILVPAIVGLALFLRYDEELAAYLIVVALAFYYLIAADVDWDGLSSFGNRYFIPLTPLFILGLSLVLNELTKWLRSRRLAMRLSVPAIGLLILWNGAFIFQWGLHLVPVRGPISWKSMIRNQFEVVPKAVFAEARGYLGNRGALMERIEQEDVKQLRSEESTTSE